jgi:hypothetical protein
MNDKIFNRYNFHNRTFCIFNEVDFDCIAELKLNYKSKSGSSYYFTNEGVFRLSNHWGRAANCKWRLLSDTKNNNRTKLGFAKWTDFYSDNDFEKLYFLEVNYNEQSVHFYHKQNDNYSSDKILRTSTQTTKRIKQIRMLFEETAWLKYLKEGNIDVLRKEIIEKLINTNLSFQEIRKEYI